MSAQIPLKPDQYLGTVGLASCHLMLQISVVYGLGDES
jgi:hypothetical protein